MPTLASPPAGGRPGPDPAERASVQSRCRPSDERDAAPGQDPYEEQRPATPADRSSRAADGAIRAVPARR